MKGLISIFVLLISFGVSADNRDEKVRELMEAQGLLQMFEDQLQLGQKQAEKQAHSMLNQMMSGLNPTHEFNQRFESAFQTFMSKISTPWSAEEIVSVWGKYYGEQFTDEELEQLLVFYRSPLAQREVVAIQEAMVSFSNHFGEAGKPILAEAVGQFIKDLRLIAKECNCRR